MECDLSQDEDALVDLLGDEVFESGYRVFVLVVGLGPVFIVLS